MPGLELPAQYQAIHHAAREGGRKERRKIMYNTNKVSPPSFIPNQFLVEEPNPEGLSVGRWEGGDALGRTLGTRCTPVSRDKAIICTAAPGHSPRCHPAVGSCTGATLHPAGRVCPAPGAGEDTTGTVGLGTRGGEPRAASPAGAGRRCQASVCSQHVFFPKCCHSIGGGGPESGIKRS